MIVGEAPGAEEERAGVPFVGTSGHELNKMLHEVGILRSECFVTNVCRVCPPGNDIAAFIAQAKKDITPKHVQWRGKWVLPQIVEGDELLKKEVALVNPNVIVALGNTALLALTGIWGIMKWRGSILGGGTSPIVIPTIHPAAILRQWELRAIAIRDLRRAHAHINSREVEKPTWAFSVRPSFQHVTDCLKTLINGPWEWIDFDLETRAGHIACAGISWGLENAISIPFMCVERQSGFWSEEEEAEIVFLLYQLLTHKRISVRGQNLLYDSQYTYRHWHFVPRVVQDTMIDHHTAWSGLPKRLDFQASMYCNHYVYWKDDGKHWDPKMGEDQLWAYNCEDCVRTREVGEVLATTIEKLGLQEVARFQQELFWPVLQAMQRGVRIDKDLRGKLADEMFEELGKREGFFSAVLGHPLNPRSGPQMQKLFYEDLKLPVVLHKKTRRPTLDDDALTKLAGREPLIRPLLKWISEYRSIGVFLSTFIQAPLDIDSRMRCSFNICGTETYRFSSSENAFGSGTNLQNIPKGVDPDDPTELTLPNIRRLFIPDPGFTFFDMDLDRADLQVVVWEANDLELKAVLREGVDVHSENARVLGISRQLAKSWVHGTNYGGGPRTMATACGITVHQAERMRERWMQAHPGIKDWHERVEAQLRSKHFVANRLGYRRYYFERVEGLLPEALAWIPQSTVACVINRAWMNIYKQLPAVWVLLQVHDSLAGEMPTHRVSELLPLIKEAARITIPYDDPLIIPVGIKTSEKSWGDCA